MLSVFRTAKFDIFAANAIAGRGRYNGKALTTLDLIHLRSHHFVEIAVEDFSASKSKAYCLHPLVVQFLITETDSDKSYDEILKLAKNRFIEYFDDVILSISSDLHSHPTKSQNSLFENKTHIQSFFNYVITSDGNLQKTCVDSPSVISEFRRDELCSVILSDHERNQYYDQYIKYAQRNGFLVDEMYYRTVKTRLYFEIDRSDECHKLVRETEALLSRNPSLEEEETAGPVLALFYWMKGRLLNATSHYKDALAVMEKSLSYYRKGSELFKTDIANIYNSIGVIYYNQRDFEKSEAYHQKAVEVAKEQLSKEDVEVMGINIQVYYTNIATALVAQWQKQTHLSEEATSPLLIKAEEYYTRAVNYDLKPSESRAKKLTNRGKLYLRMERYDDAEQDLSESLQIRKDTSVPPNSNLTHAYHNIGRYFFLRGNNPKTGKV
jgi:tetratricopeptide (TPR) repeat protein